MVIDRLMIIKPEIVILNLTDFKELLPIFFLVAEGNTVMSSFPDPQIVTNGVNSLLSASNANLLCGET